MTQKAPGKHYREGMSLMDVLKMFPDDRTSEEWFTGIRWPDGAYCPSCDSTRIQSNCKHKTMPYRCRDCHKRFSVKVGTVMEGTKLGFQVWAIAIYLLNTNLKGVSSMKLHRDLGVTQKTAWFLAMRIRKAWEVKSDPFSGVIEVDETWIGGKEKNKHACKKLHAGRGGVGKTAVIGAKQRGGKIKAMPLVNTDAISLHNFIGNNVKCDSVVYTDSHKGYLGLQGKYKHESVNHSAGQYVNGQAHTNGIESFWAMLKRGYHGTYHKMSMKHLHRYVNEFASRHNVRGKDTVVQMVALVTGMHGKSLRYKDLIE